MAERLTRNNKVNFYFHDEASNMVYYKLQKLEDIMEKYHCNDIEELEKKLADSDTWQKACELACEKIVDMLGDCPIETVNWQQEDDWCEENCDKHEKLLCWDRYFYQQAKRGWNINK